MRLEHHGELSTSADYDASGYLSSLTDVDGVTTTYRHDARGLELSRTEAIGTPQERTVTTDWHPRFRLPVRIAEPGRVTEYRYGTNGRLLTKRITDPATGASRATSRTYTPDSLPASVFRTDAWDDVE